MGVETIIIGAVLGAVAGGVISHNAPKPPSPQPLPESPASEVNQAAIQQEAAVEERKERRTRAARSKTILTSPGGVLEEAPVGKKTLLGE